MRIVGYVLAVIALTVATAHAAPGREMAWLAANDWAGEALELRINQPATAVTPAVASTEAPPAPRQETVTDVAVSDGGSGGAVPVDDPDPVVTVETAPETTAPPDTTPAIQWEPVLPQQSYELTYDCERVVITNTGPTPYTYWVSYDFHLTLTPMPDHWWPWVAPGETVMVDITPAFNLGEHVTIWLDSGGVSHQPGALAILSPCSR